MSKFLTFTKDTLGAHAELADAEKHNAENGGDVIITTIDELLACAAITTAHMVKLYNIAVKAVDPEAKEEKSIGKDTSIAAVKLFAALDAAFGTADAQASAELDAAVKAPKKERKSKKEKEASGPMGEYAGRRWIVAPVEPKPRRAPTDRGNPARGYNSINIIRANPGISTEDYMAKGGRLRDLQKDFKVNKNVLEVLGDAAASKKFIDDTLAARKVADEAAVVAAAEAAKKAAEDEKVKAANAAAKKAENEAKENAKATKEAAEAKAAEEAAKTTK